jgi:hypothetical protein
MPPKRKGGKPSSNGNAKKPAIGVGVPAAATSTSTVATSKGPTLPVSFSTYSGIVQNAPVLAVVPQEVAVPPLDNRSTGTSDADWYDQCRRKGLKGSVGMLQVDLTNYVRGDLFSKLKFIMDPRQLTFSNDKTSICFKICRDMGVVGADADPKEKEAPSDRAANWWETYKSKVLKTLNNKRADVTSGIKRMFLSK